MTITAEITVEIEAFVTTEEDRVARRNKARDAVIEVLERHGHNLPGIADLCAGAALKAVNLRLD